MAKRKSSGEPGISIGGDVSISAGRDANVAGGDIATSTGGLEFKADWRDVAMSAMGEAQVAPNKREAIGRRLDRIEDQLESPEPDVPVIKTLVGQIEQLAPLVATAIRTALVFLK